NLRYQRAALYPPLVLLVLQLVLLDVGPELLRDLGARNRLRADDLGERRARVHRLHERGVWLPRALLLRGLLRSFLRFLSHLLSFKYPECPAEAPGEGG